MESKKEAEIAGLADMWFWPFGMWKAATDSWLQYMSGFLGVDGGRKANPMPFPGLAVDPWAVLRIWMPQVDAILEPLNEAGADDAVRIRMRMQLPGLGGAGEALAIDAVVGRDVPVKLPADEAVLEAVPLAPAVEAPKPKAPARKRSTKTAPVAGDAEVAAAPVRRRAPKVAAVDRPAASAESAEATSPAKPASRRRKTPSPDTGV